METYWPIQNLVPNDHWLLSEINPPSKIEVYIQIRLICVRFTVGARFPVIPLCSSLHVAPTLVSRTNMMQKRGWKAASEMRLWDTAASGLVVFLLLLGSLTQGKVSCCVMSSPVEGPPSEDLRPPASKRCWIPREAEQGLVAILMVTPRELIHLVSQMVKIKLRPFYILTCQVRNLRVKIIIE